MPTTADVDTASIIGLVREDLGGVTNHAVYGVLGRG